MTTLVLSSDDETPVERDIPICDAHHHLWDRPGQRYLISDFLEEVRDSGHNVVRSVVVESGLFPLSPNGAQAARAEATEAARAAEVAAESTSSAIGACAVIVGHVDLRQGVDVRSEIESLLEATGGRLKAIRHCGTWDSDEGVRGGPPIAQPRLYGDSRFRAGLAALADYDLAFDAWAYQTQHDEVIDLANAFPEIRIVFNHTGGVLGTGPYAGRRDELYQLWRSGMAKLSRTPNVTMKLGGLGMQRCGFPFFRRPARPSSAELAVAWRPWIEEAIALFGARRCMFESNFPVDRATCSYRVLWNSFKAITAGASISEKRALFHDTAGEFYR